MIIIHCEIKSVESEHIRRTTRNMNRVNANTWATDIGRSPRADNKIKRPVLKDVMVTLMDERVNSTSIMPCGRNTDINRTDIFSNEVVKGVQLYHMLKKPESSHKNVLTMSLKSTQGNSTHFIKQSKIFKDTGGSIGTRRPVTAVSRYTAKHCQLSEGTVTFAEDALKIMSISKHMAAHGNQLLTIQKNNQTDTETERAKLAKPIPRAKSAPPFAFTAFSEAPRNIGHHYHLPLFWRTRNSYHRKQNTDITEARSYKGTQLRSLFQNSGDISCHEKCPYKCRSCFRACLASDSYIQEQLDRKKQDFYDTEV